MKARVFLLIFTLITIACLTISGAQSIELMFKSILLVVMLAGLLVVGIVFIVKDFDEEDRMQHT